MDKLVLTDWLAILSAVGVIVALVSNVRGMRDRGESKASEMAEMRGDIKHIREKVDKTDLTLSGLRGDIDGIKERVTRVEDSAKSAHKRIDRMEGKEERT